MNDAIIQHQPQLSDLMYYNYTDLDDYINFVDDKTSLIPFRRYSAPILDTRKKLYNINDLLISRIYDDTRPISSYKQRCGYTRKKYHSLSSQYLLIRGGSS